MLEVLVNLKGRILVIRTISFISFLNGSKAVMYFINLRKMCVSIWRSYGRGLYQDLAIQCNIGKQVAVFCFIPSPYKNEG